jgi:hypothetical protein
MSGFIPKDWMLKSYSVLIIARQISTNAPKDSLFTVVLLLKLRNAQNTHSSIKNSRSIQISTHYKCSCLHGCSEYEHKMATVTSYNAQIRPVLFCHSDPGYAYHVWCANYRVCGRLKKQDRCVLRMINIKEKMKQINHLQLNKYL